jgi:hypothetical protein
MWDSSQEIQLNVISKKTKKMISFQKKKVSRIELEKYFCIFPGPLGGHWDLL